MTYTCSRSEAVESKQPWDYYKLLATLPGDQAFMPLSKSSCPLVKQAGAARD